MAKPNKKELLKRRATLDKRGHGDSTDAQPRFISFAHPKNLFHVDVPVHWEITHESDPPYSTNMNPKGREGVYVTFFRMPLQFDVAKVFDDDQFQAGLTKMLTSVGAVNSRPDPTIAYPCMTSDKDEPDQGGQRWLVAHDDVIVCISTGFPESQQHIYGPLFERMMTSFRIKRDQETLFFKLFHYVFTEIKRLAPDQNWLRDGDGGDIKSDRMKISIGNLFVRVQSSPNNLKALADEFVAGIVSTTRQASTIGHESFESVRDAIVPLLKCEGYLQMVAQQAHAESTTENGSVGQLVSTPWMTDIHVCYAIDSKTTFRLVNENDASQWKVDAETLHAVAIKNLTRITEPEFQAVVDEINKRGIAMLEPVAAAASAYVLHPRLYEMIQPILGSDLLVAIPARDALVVFGNQTSRLRVIADQVRKDHATADLPLSDRLFRLTPDGMCLA